MYFVLGKKINEKFNFEKPLILTFFVLIIFIFNTAQYSKTIQGRTERYNYENITNEIIKFNDDLIKNKDEGIIIGDKLVDVGFAFFAPSKKGRERRGSVASAAVNNDRVQKDYKQRYSDPSRTNALHALVAIARQLADTPENKDFKANFSTVDNFD